MHNVKIIASHNMVFYGYIDKHQNNPHDDKSTGLVRYCSMRVAIYLEDAKGAAWRLPPKILTLALCCQAGFELAVVEFVVEAALLKELLMSSLFHDIAVVHHKDQVSVSDG